MRQELLDALREGPIEITTSAGDRFQVASVEFALIGNTSVVVMIPAPERENGYRYHTIKLSLIASFERLQSAN